MPPVPAVGSGVCTVTGAEGNAVAGTPCTGYYYGGIEGRCTGTACCQGTGYGGHGWCGTGYPGQHGRWGSCSPECDNSVGFDEASYESDAARAAAIPELIATTAAPTMSPSQCGIPSEQPDSPIPTTLQGFNFFMYGYLSNFVSGMPGYTTFVGTTEECMAACNAGTPNPCQAFTYLPGMTHCHMYFHNDNGVADALSALTSNVDRFVDRTGEYGGHFVYTWVRCGNGYPQRIFNNQYHIPESSVDCVFDLAATAATCQADCGTVPGIGSPAASNGGAECPTYDCQPGDGACPVPASNANAGIDVQDGSSIGLPEYMIYKVATDTDIGDSLDQATALCASARTGGQLLGNYEGTNTCGGRVFPPVSGGQMYLTTWAQTDGTDMQFGGNKGGLTVCGNDHHGNFIGRTYSWNKNWDCSNGVCNQKVACIAPKASGGRRKL